MGFEKIEKVNLDNATLEELKKEASRLELENYDQLDRDALAREVLRHQDKKSDNVEQQD